MHSCVVSSFQSCCNAFRHEQLSISRYFLMFTWLSIEHSFKTFFYMSLYSEEERRFAKSGICVHKAQESNQWQNVIEKAGNRPLLQPPKLIASEARHQAADFVHESEPLYVCDAEKSPIL